jgi:hypothetical protein
MTDIYISEPAAMHILQTQGGYSADQARIILMHSLKIATDRGTHYPAQYIRARAK